LSIPAVRPWPERDLEAVPNCPVCGSDKRALLYQDLTDRVFGFADGTWNLYRCAHCGGAYLDPRPTPLSIGRAYAGYYTHQTQDHPIVRRKGLPRTLLHDSINGYQNWRYGLKRSPSSPLGRWLLLVIPPLRSAADAECRHLPPLPPGGGRLLDVGCGNGGFLMLAQQAGWQVEGLDFDADAVLTARSRGLTVRHGGTEVLDGEHDRFDVITLCHVIEHVHDPRSVLCRLHSLLKPGGTLWLDTPNLDSLGSRRFRANWRDLDPPRHLVIFTASSLRKALRDSGYSAIHQHWRGMSVFEVYAASEAIARSGTAKGGSYRGRPPMHAIAAELREMMQPARREFLTVSAKKG